MSSLSGFLAYARAFELAQASDDFSLLVPCFAPDVRHTVEGEAPLGADDRGREAVIAGLRASVYAIDRRFDARIPEVLEGPVLRDGGVWMRFGLRLRRAGLPDLLLEGEHLTRHDGSGAVLAIEERILADSDRATREYLARHDAALRPAASKPAALRAEDLPLLRDALQRTFVRAYGGAKSEQDVAAALSICHPGFVIDTIPFGVTTRDREDTAAQLAFFFSVFPDYRADTEAVVSDAAGAAWWGEFSMSFAGPLLGHAPTGRRARLPGFSAFEFRDGLISRERFYFDLGTLCRQIGLPLGELEASLAGLRAAAA